MTNHQELLKMALDLLEKNATYVYSGPMSAGGKNCTYCGKNISYGPHATDCMFVYIMIAAGRLLPEDKEKIERLNKAKEELRKAQEEVDKIQGEVDNIHTTSKTRRVEHPWR